MTTIDMECPHCGRIGSVPRDKSQGRLVCRKCNQIFHLTPSGRAVPGEPPHAPTEHHATPEAKSALGPSFDFSAVKLPFLLGVLGVLLAILGGVTLRQMFFQPVSRRTVADHARTVAVALAQDRLDVVKEHTLPETVSEAARFFGKARPMLVELVKDVPAQGMKVDVLVVDLSPEHDKAQVVGTFSPDHGTTRADEIAAAARLDGTGKPPVSLNFFWAKGPDGSWKLDGKTTAALGMK